MPAIIAAVDPLTLSPDDLLQGSFDVEAKARELTEAYVVKGMFFSRLRSKMGERWHEVEPLLSRPPRLGHYVPFADYPQADYMRLSAAAAAFSYPSFSIREALRRLARDDFDVFASSTFGKVVLAAVGDVHKALLTSAAIYTKMAPGEWVITNEELDRNTVCIDFVPHVGGWEYQLGQWEGLVQHYGARPTVTIVSLPRGGLRFQVAHR